MQTSLFHKAAWWKQARCVVVQQTAWCVAATRTALCHVFKTHLPCNLRESSARHATQCFVLWFPSFDSTLRKPWWSLLRVRTTCRCPIRCWWRARRAVAGCRDTSLLCHLGVSVVGVPCGFDHQGEGFDHQSGTGIGDSCLPRNMLQSAVQLTTPTSSQTP